MGNPIGTMLFYRLTRFPWEGSLVFLIETAIEWGAASLSRGSHQAHFAGKLCQPEGTA
jgi:hypothetical protein